MNERLKGKNEVRNLAVGLLHYSCLPVVGGVEEVLDQQSSLLDRYSYRVKVLAGAGRTLNRDYPIEINPLLGSRNRRVLQAHRLLVEENDSRGIETLASEIEGYLREQLRHLDIVLAHNVLTMPFNLPLTSALWKLAESESMGIVSWGHDSPYFYADYLPHLDYSPWTVLKKVHPKIHYVTISENRREQFLRLYDKAHRIHVVNNGIDPASFLKLDATTVRLVEEEGLLGEDFLIFHPCRLHPRKNVELSIRVTRALRDRGVPARLLVTAAHDPHELETLDYYRKLIRLTRQLDVERNVLILGEYQFQNGDRISADRLSTRDFYLISDVLFLPSQAEGFGLPLLESALTKLPIMCSKIAPFTELAREDVCYFDLQDTPSQIATKMLSFATGKPHRFFRRTKSSHLWDSIYRTRLVPLFQEVLEEQEARVGVHS